MVCHTNKFPFKCSECDKAFKSSYVLKEHMYMIHGKDTFTFKKHVPLQLLVCKICDKQFTRQSQLLRHKAVHDNKRQFKCDVCLKGFNNIVVLRTHKLVHSERKYGCNYCGKKFKRNCHLKSHIISFHSEEINVSKFRNLRLHKCTYCSKTLSNKTRLAIHIRRHTKERPFSCKECNLKFISQDSLKFHAKKHTEDNQHPCKECDLYFTSQDALKSHMKTHKIAPDNEQLICDECSKSLPSQYQYTGVRKSE